MVDQLTDKQRTALQQFKEACSDLISERDVDEELLRWLRARQFNVKKAEQMYRESMAWRSSMGADSILEDWTPPDVLSKYVPGGILGYSKQGLPIWLEHMGNVDLKGLMYSAKKSDIMKYKCWQLETACKHFREQSEKLGKRIDRMVLLYDFTHYGLRHLWKPGVDLITEIFTMVEKNYPENLEIIYCYNAPRIFPIAYNLVKPFLQEETRKKIFVLGRDFRSKLLELIDEDQLPMDCGGTMVEPDGLTSGASKLSIGGEVPKTYYLKGSDLMDLESVSVASIGRASSLQLVYEVIVPGSVVRWLFSTEHHDIGFGIFKKTAGNRQKAGEMEMVLESQRYNCHMVPEDGSILIDRPGSYVVRFDNTFSWVNSKTIRYQIEILPPTDVNRK